MAPGHLPRVCGPGPDVARSSPGLEGDTQTSPGDGSRWGLRAGSVTRIRTAKPRPPRSRREVPERVPVQGPLRLIFFAQAKSGRGLHVEPGDLDIAPGHAGVPDVPTAGSELQGIPGDMKRQVRRYERRGTIPPCDHLGAMIVPPPTGIMPAVVRTSCSRPHTASGLVARIFAPRSRDAIPEAGVSDQSRPMTHIVPRNGWCSPPCPTRGNTPRKSLPALSPIGPVFLSG